MRLLICAGGTGGGVYPALAALQALRKSKPDDMETLWVGSEGGMEAEIIQRQNIPYTSIPAAGIHGVGLRTLPRNLNLIRQGITASRSILADFQPEVIFFTGGYVAVPLALAARASSQPRPKMVLYVPDIEPGMALKFLGRFANKIALTAPESAQFFPARAPTAVTGYPVRPDLGKWSRQAAVKQFNLSPAQPILLVFGGSKGARSINQALLGSLTEILALTQVIHISGSLGWNEIETAYRSLSESQQQRYRPFPYLHEEMGAAFTAADLVVSRAGASTLGEFPLFGLPAVLVPYPYAWRYQKVNADYLVSRGAAVLLEDESLPAELLPTLQDLFSNPQQTRAMQKQMQALAQPDAAARLAQLLSQPTGLEQEANPW